MTVRLALKKRNLHELHIGKIWNLKSYVCDPVQLVVETSINHSRSPSENSSAEEISIGTNESRFPRILPKDNKIIFRIFFCNRIRSIESQFITFKGNYLSLNA